MPDAWSDMDYADMMFAIEILFRYKPDYAHATIALRYIPRKTSRKLNASHLLDIADTLAWMDPIYTMPKENEAKYTGVPFTHFIHHGIMYHLPERYMMNSTGQEYAIADEYYNEKDNPDALLHLISTLCRPRAVAPDPREADTRARLVSRDQIAAQAKAIKDLSPSIQQLLLYFYEEARRMIYSFGKDYIFHEPQPAEEGQPKPQAQEGPMFGWWSVYIDVAKAGVFGNLSQVHNSNIYEIIMYLVQEKKLQKEQLAEIDRIKARHK